MERVAGKINISLNLNSLSEDNLSEAESVNSKRAATDFESDEFDDIKDDSKIAIVKKVKTQDVVSQWWLLL